MQFVDQKIITVDGNTAIKRYALLEKVGEGAFSQCYRVQVHGTNQIYAMKIISKEKMKVLQKEKLVEQIRIHQMLSHPHIVFLDHWFQNSSNQYIFLEYCANKTLDDRCKKFEGTDEKTIRRYGVQIVDAIKYLHSKQILHRDLKLTNFFLNQHDQIKLGDFGFACRLRGEGELKRDPCGTPNFASPELIGGFGYSYPSDVWSLGVILYRMKFGVYPFQMFDLNQTLFKIKSADYTFPKWIQISDELKDLISKILVIDYDERLTLNQIEQHPFFRKQQVPRTNSFKNLFNKLFSGEKTEKSRRMDSCETKKDIKKILKDKTLETSKSTKIIPAHNSLAQKSKELIGRAQQTMKEISSPKFESGSTDRSKLDKFRGNMLPPKIPNQSERLPSRNISPKKENFTILSELNRREQALFNETAHFHEATKVFEVTFRQNQKLIQKELEPQLRSQKKGMGVTQNSFGNVQLKKPQKPDLGNSKSLLSTNQSVSKVTEKPSQRIARMKNTFRQQISNSILQYYSQFLVYEIHFINDHYLIYLTNGIRQILTSNNIYIIYQPGYILDREGFKIIEPPKMIDYLVREKMQESKFKLTQQTFLSIVEKKHYITKWKIVIDRIGFSVLQSTVITTGRHGLFYLKTPETDYLYTASLEMVTDEYEIGNSRQYLQRYGTGQKNAGGRERSKSKHKKLLE